MRVRRRHDGELRLEVRAGVGVALGHGEELLGEAQHHAAEDVQAPVRQVIAQTALDHGREHRLEVRHQARGRLGPRADELRTPPVAEHHVARRQASGPQRRPPPGDGLVTATASRDLGHEAFGEAVEQPLLARDVVVERHRLHARSEATRRIVTARVRRRPRPPSRWPAHVSGSAGRAPGLRSSVPPHGHGVPYRVRMSLHRKAHDSEALMTTTTAPAVRSLEADRAALLRTARLTGLLYLGVGADRWDRLPRRTRPAARRGRSHGHAGQPRGERGARSGSA